MFIRRLMMHITCPSCAAVYDVPEEALLNPRELRCQGCNHIWMHQPANTVPTNTAPAVGREMQQQNQMPAEQLLPTNTAPAVGREMQQQNQMPAEQLLPTNTAPAVDNMQMQQQSQMPAEQPLPAQNMQNAPIPSEASPIGIPDAMSGEMDANQAIENVDPMIGTGEQAINHNMGQLPQNDTLPPGNAYSNGGMVDNNAPSQSAPIQQDSLMAPPLPPMATNDILSQTDEALEIEDSAGFDKVEASPSPDDAMRKDAMSSERSSSSNTSANAVAKNTTSAQQKPSKGKVSILRTAWIILILLVMLIVAGAYFFKKDIIERFPAISDIYTMIGIADVEPVYGMRYEQPVIEFVQEADGFTLSVSGLITNTMAESYIIPALSVKLLDTNGELIRVYPLAVAGQRIGSGQSETFSLTVSEELERVVYVELGFEVS